MIALLTRQGLSPLNFCAEYAVVLCFFARLEPRRESRSRLGYLCLALIAPLYLYVSDVSAPAAAPSALINPLLRWVVYVGAVAGYLWLSKEVRWSQALYLSAFYTNFYNAARTLVAMAYYIPYNGSEDGRILRSLSISIAVLALEFLAAALVSRLIDFRRIREIGPARVWLVLLTNFLMLYFKTANLLNPNEAFAGQLVDQFLYPACTIFALLTLLVLFEFYQLSQEKRRKMELEQLTHRYEVYNAQHTIEANQDLRRLYHDMKNHLLAIRSMEPDSPQVSAYVDGLLDDLSEYDLLVSTGLPVMDAFLSEKLRQAKKEAIACDLCLDLTPLSGVSPADLIAIFGNALDNALEAARNVADPERRAVFVKSTRQANTLFVRFSNYYAGELRREKGRLASIKADPALHGIGLRSIGKAAQRCGGGMDVRIDEEEKQFVLTVVLPATEKPEQTQAVS